MGRCAIRYEPGFRARYVTPLEFNPTEEIARSISWGLMQVMGQVAREHEFQRPFLSALCDPSAGLTFGCIVLAAKITAASGDAPRGLALSERRRKSRLRRAGAGAVPGGTGDAARCG